MKRAMRIVAVAALCVAGSAVAQDRSGLIGSGTRTEDSGQVIGSGNAAGQMMGSGGFTTSTQDIGGGTFGSGNRSSGQIMGSGGRTEDGGQVIGSGAAVTTQDGGYLGSGLAVRVLRLFDDLSLLVVSSDEGTFVISIEE